METIELKDVVVSSIEVYRMDKFKGVTIDVRMENGDRLEIFAACEDEDGNVLRGVYDGNDDWIMV